MSEVGNLVWRSIKWRFQNPITIVMTLIQPLMWLLLFANLFSGKQDNYVNFVLAGILVMAILSGAGMSGIANYSLKATGSYYRVIISFIFDVIIKTGVLGFICLLFLLVITVFFVSALSYMISISIPDENGFIAIINTFILPLFFLNTALMEKSSMPKVFQLITAINPFTFVVQSLRNIITDTTINWKLYVIAFMIMLILTVLAGAGAKKKLEVHY